MIFKICKKILQGLKRLIKKMITLATKIYSYMKIPAITKGETAKMSERKYMSNKHFEIQQQLDAADDKITAEIMPVQKKNVAKLTKNKFSIRWQISYSDTKLNNSNTYIEVLLSNSSTIMYNGENGLLYRCVPLNSHGFVTTPNHISTTMLNYNWKKLNNDIAIDIDEGIDGIQGIALENHNITPLVVTYSKKQLKTIGVRARVIKNAMQVINNTSFIYSTLIDVPHLNDAVYSGSVYFGNKYIMQCIAKITTSRSNNVILVFVSLIAGEFNTLIDIQYV